MSFLSNYSVEFSNIDVRLEKLKRIDGMTNFDKLYPIEEERKLILRAYKELVKTTRPSFKRGDSERLRMAFEMSAEAHKEMRRKSGEPYIFHPIEVAQIVAQEIGLGTTSVICALLHDTVEDTNITLDDIGREFDSEIKLIIDGLTKISSLTAHTSAVAAQAENLKKILLTLSDDIRVIIIKIADRLHNMRTMKSMPSHKQFKISSETLYLYAPMAHRLGLYTIKSELEDLSLKYTSPDVYADIANELAVTKKERESYIQEFIGPMKKALKDHGIEDIQIFGRPKTIYSIWNKIKKKGVTFEEIYDLFAIRIVASVPYEKEKAVCWNIYSVISDIYRPNPERLRDWISNPKSNGYESLHTTVMGPKGKWVEVQIRTERMDQIAEKGVAAHWKYKSDQSGESLLDEWIRKVREFLQNPDANALDFMNDFRHNLYENELYVFTPKGDLVSLPSNASVIDFAFDIHTEVGSHCIGAKINGKLMPISHKVNSGDQIEVLTSKKQSPSESWLNFTITSKARTKIKSMLKDEKRKIASDGKEILKRKLKAIKVSFNNELLEELTVHFKNPDSQTFLYNIGTKTFDTAEIRALKFVNGKIKQEKSNTQKTIQVDNYNQVQDQLASSTDLLIFSGFADQVDYTIAKCCNPVPGDDVFGFLTISNGIKIHSSSCPNSSDLMARYPYRIIKTKWAAQNALTFLTGLRITGIDDVGLINRLTSAISDKMKINMRSLSFDTTDGVFEGNIKVFVKDNAQLKKLIKEIKTVEGVYAVKRYQA